MEFILAYARPLRGCLAAASCRQLPLTTIALVALPHSSVSRSYYSYCGYGNYSGYSGYCGYCSDSNHGSYCNYGDYCDYGGYFKHGSLSGPGLGLLLGRHACAIANRPTRAT